MTEDYYSWGDIRFSRPQMLWGIQWLSVLEAGDWPPEPSTGYTDIAEGIQRSRSTKTRFLPAALFYAEITDRLKTTKEAGEALVHEVQHGLTEYEDLSPPAKRALNYISGFRRRKQSFQVWVRQVKYRKKW